jgi:hypothetical protein
LIHPTTQMGLEHCTLERSKGCQRHWTERPGPMGRERSWKELVLHLMKLGLHLMELVQRWSLLEVQMGMG